MLGTTILSNGKGHFGLTDRNDQTRQSGPSSKLVPNIPVGPSQNGPLHLMNHPKFPECWVEWKAPKKYKTSPIFMGSPFNDIVGVNYSTYNKWDSSSKEWIIRFLLYCYHHLRASIEAPSTKYSALCVCEFLCEQLIYVAFLRLVLSFEFCCFHSLNLAIKFSNSKAVRFDPSNKIHPSNTG